MSSGKGSARRPGVLPPGAWETIFGPRVLPCPCADCKGGVKDGGPCAVCQPTEDGPSDVDSNGKEAES